MNKNVAGFASVCMVISMSAACHRSAPPRPPAPPPPVHRPSTVAPTDVAPAPNPPTVVVGCVPDNDGLAIWRDDGRALTFSGSSDGGTSPLPQLVAGVDHVAGLVSDGIRLCARTAAGGVFCWGGYLGPLAGGGTDDPTPRPNPNAVGGITDATQLALGASRACVIRADHTVSCWGDLSPFGVAAPARPQAIAGLESAAQIALVDGTLCIRTTTGTVRCAGSTDYGLAGVAPATGDHGESPTPAHPTDIAGLTGVAEIAMSRLQACARLGDGTVKCWGVGFGVSPVAVGGVSGATAIALGDSLNQVEGGTEGSASTNAAHAVGCAWSADGHANCWTVDSDHLPEGQLDAALHASDAQRVTDLDGATHVSFAQETERPRACALLTGAQVREFVFNGNQITARVLTLPN